MNSIPLTPSRARRGQGLGFTLVELLVTLLVLAILLSLAVPSFSRMLAANRMATQTNELLAGLKLARAEAIRRGQNVSVRAATVGTPANFGTGWIVFTDADGDGAAPGTPTATDGTTIRVSGPFSGGTVATRVSSSLGSYSAADRGYVVFTARGANANAAAYFKLCDSSQTDIPGRVVQVSVVGNVTLDSTTATCP